MKKFNLLALLLLLTGKLVFAQDFAVTGNVKDTQGDPLHFAFVQDGEKHSIYTDTLGNFTLQTSANATLRINCAGYRDTTIAVDNKNSIAVIMNLAGNVGNSNQAAAVANTANNQAMKESLAGQINLAQGSFNAPAQFDAARGANLPTFTPKEETQGSRYLIKGWAHGFVINAKGETVQNPGFLFAYDKIGGGLLLTKDKASAIEIDRDMVKSFTLYDNLNNPYTFEQVPQIDKAHYIELIASGNKYKIYKTIKTTFTKANYSTDGVMSTGNNYDEYVDEYTYYVYDVQTNSVQKVALKKKALKDVFAKDNTKVNSFISDHSADQIDDTYLASLGSYLNN